jgi:ATP phosphoribosyltransferase
VPEESDVTAVEELAGASIATVYPRLVRELLPGGVTLVDVTGSVELAPRLGLADAIVDLVSSGNTLRTNGLRSVGVLLESEAVLVAGDPEGAAPFAAMLRAVVEARRHRYLMLNAPEEAVPRIAELVAPRVPSVLPLAQPGLVAVHALVPSADVWRLLPELEAAGGSSILIVPVERLAA